MEEKRMSSTALGAEKAIIFISEVHEKFYYEKLKEVRHGRPEKTSYTQQCNFRYTRQW